MDRSEPGREDGTSHQTQVFCGTSSRTVDAENCYACGISCAEARAVTGREPDRDARLVDLAHSGLLLR